MRVGLPAGLCINDAKGLSWLFQPTAFLHTYDSCACLHHKNHIAHQARQLDPAPLALYSNGCCGLDLWGDALE